MLALGALAATGATAVVAVEVVGRSTFESEITARLAEAGITGDVDVVVGRPWWPTVWAAILTGDLDRVAVRIDGGDLSGLPVESADYLLEDLGGDLSLRDRTIEVDSLGRGAVRLVIDPSVVGEAVGVELSVRDGELVDAEGQAVEATLDGDQLVLSGAGIPSGDAAPSLTVVDAYLLPCRPDVTVADGGIRLACAGDDLPGILRAPLAGVGDEPPPPEAVEDLPPPQTIVRPGG